MCGRDLAIIRANERERRVCTMSSGSCRTCSPSVLNEHAARQCAVATPGKWEAAATEAAGTEETNPMMKVRDIMTREVCSVPVDALLEDASAELVSHGVSALPVLDGGRVVGVLSKSDFVDRGPGAIENVRVGHAMTPLVFHVRTEDPAILAVRLMVAERVHRVIVLGEHGELEGIVSTMDIVRAIARGDDLRGDDPD